jgi:hypothetical protein
MLIEASELKLFGASEPPNKVVSALEAAELSLEAVRGNTVAFVVYTGGIILP